MLSAVRPRALWRLSQRAQAPVKRSFVSSTIQQKESSDTTVPVKTPALEALQETAGTVAETGVMQAPNRAAIWSRSQRPRTTAMTGPRFEQTVMENQVFTHLRYQQAHTSTVCNCLLDLLLKYSSHNLKQLSSSSTGSPFAGHMIVK